MNDSITLKDVTTGEMYKDVDMKTYSVLVRTVSMMIYPGSKFRSKREKLEKSFYNNSASQKIISDSRKHEKRGHIVGSIFKIQCDHYFMGKKRSLNEILFAYENGFFAAWSESGWNIGLAKRYMKDFRCVSHLYAADSMLTQAYIQSNPGMNDKFFRHQFNSLFRDPAFFFAMADEYANMAVNAGLVISRKQDLWMPSGWRTVVGEYPARQTSIQEGYEAELELFDRYAEQYRETRAWEYNYTRPR